MYTKILVLLALLALFALANGTATYCERWKFGSEFRCAKDDYPADIISVRNRAGSNISFKVGKWLSRSDVLFVVKLLNYSDQLYSLKSGESINIDFSEVDSGYYHQLYIYECRINNRYANCPDTVIPTPSLASGAVNNCPKSVTDMPIAHL
ncbi:uncharacterized protein LOC126885416 [Diabrotica virgifera virgifera]|uniref:Uncharacterized protein n=1 Tax=Diabrotica virgifera virgifera TaxID=50390 RepID=A0ABM5KCM4_DIAVI|nr:uncharacterized protein LOC126885416 [Diabrotica virgifera virgifera]